MKRFAFLLALLAAALVPAQAQIYLSSPTTAPILNNQDTIDIYILDNNTSVFTVACNIELDSLTGATTGTMRLEAASHSNNRLDNSVMRWKTVAGTSTTIDGAGTSHYRIVASEIPDRRLRLRLFTPSGSRTIRVKYDIAAKKRA